MEDRNPLGVIYFMLWRKGPDFEMLRINGDKARIEDYLDNELSKPMYEVTYHQPLHKVHGSWSVFLTVKLVSVEVN